MHVRRILLLSTLGSLAQANTRQADPGTANDTLCTAAVLRMANISLDNALLLWPRGSCCTTTDCELQSFGCAASLAHSGTGGNICCFKAGGYGAEAGVCRCGIDEQPQGTCF